METNVHLPAREAKDAEVRRAIVGRDIKEGYAIPRRGGNRYLRMVSGTNDGATQMAHKKEKKECGEAEKQSQHGVAPDALRRR